MTVRIGRIHGDDWGVSIRERSPLLTVDEARLLANELTQAIWLADHRNRTEGRT